MINFTVYVYKQVMAQILLMYGNCTTLKNPITERSNSLTTIAILQYSIHILINDLWYYMSAWDIYTNYQKMLTSS